MSITNYTTMAEESKRIKHIIMDKAPSGNTLRMSADLGFTNGDLQPLADAFNLEFNTNITGPDLQPLNSVEEVTNYVISQIP